MTYRWSRVSKGGGGGGGGGAAVVRGPGSLDGAIPAGRSSSGGIGWRPKLVLRFFKSQAASGEQADDLLQETWLRIHRVRHTYRPGEPVLPWIYAIARRVRVDGYRRTRRITLHETTMELLPERSALAQARNRVPAFETLVAALPDAQREVVTMLKVGGLTLEEVARATSSTVGAVKQKAHRAYQRLRKLWQQIT